MVIPIYDNDPLDRNPYAVVTWTLIAINIVVFLIQLGASEDTESGDGARLRADPGRDHRQGGTRRQPGRRSCSAFTYMFLHGGWSHIIGNMLFLWVLGDNIEDAFGSVRFFFFYMLCGAAGGLAHLVDASGFGRAAGRRVRRGRRRGRRLSDAAALREDHRCCCSASCRSRSAPPGCSASGR